MDKVFIGAFIITPTSRSIASSARSTTWLLRKHGFSVTQEVIRAILRDWMESKTFKDPNYPIMPFQNIIVPIASERESETYVLERLKIHMEASKNWQAYAERYPLSQKVSELSLYLCTPEERWYRGEVWAVMKKGQKNAVRGGLKKTEPEALQFIGKSKTKGLYDEHRPGVNKRCLSFCPVRYLCQRNPKTANLGDAPKC